MYFVLIRIVQLRNRRFFVSVDRTRQLVYNADSVNSANCDQLVRDCNVSCSMLKSFLIYAYLQVMDILYSCEIYRADSGL